VFLDLNGTLVEVLKQERLDELTLIPGMCPRRQEEFATDSGHTIFGSTHQDRHQRVLRSVPESRQLP
jgi:uncharacterized membrane protein YheB (UPF0754 family)